MKTLLYITVNAKPENLSVSKTVGRTFVNEFKKNHNDVEIKELNLYDFKIPELKYNFFDNRNTLVDAKNISLTPEDIQEIERVKKLANDFKAADYYVIATPMWNMFFPALLKEYIDCIVQNEITVKIAPKEITGLLKDKERTMVYIQSSGGPVPRIIEGRISYGSVYLKALFNFMGIKNYHEILVDKTGFTEEDERKSIEKGKKDAIELAKRI